ncbi:MAG: outer membrane protein SusC, starch binding [Segetibacter sp.]|nr:outer membrane protein SusC, starch binding [Segetibacter sp.]
MKSKILPFSMLFIISILCANIAIAQKINVKGKITRDDGTTLPGVTVQVKGTTTGVSSDNNGEYSIAVSKPSDVLVFTSVGFTDHEVAVKNQTSIDVRMHSANTKLNDVVVIGYGTQRQKDVTGSVSSISAKDFNTGPQLSPQQLIQGKMAGVNIAQNSGKPGGSNTIRIRGGTSISASNEPLYVIDGVAISTSSISRQPNLNSGDVGMLDQEPVNPLNTINPNDIENITVLKDASATAIYGSRGANGVIVITTKGGTSGAIRTSYSTRFGIASVTKKLEMLNPDEYRKAAKDLNLVIRDSLGTTNWQDEILRSAFSQDHNLSLSGGSENTQYRASIGYNTQQGVVIASQQNIGSARMNIKHKTLGGKLDFDFRVTGSQINAKTAPISNTVGGESGTNMLYDAYVFNPTFPVYNRNGQFNQFSQFTVNPVSYADHILDEATTKRFLGSLSTTYKIFEPLSFNVNLGYSYQDISRNSYIKKASPLGGGLGGQANVLNTGDWNKLMETTLRFQKEYGMHNFNAIAGYSFQYFIDQGSRATGSGFISDEFKWNSLQAARTINGLSTYKESNTLISYYGRINYAYSDRYLVTATIRRDASSRFGAGNKWGTFPSGSVAWRISNEKFFPKNTPVSDLKFRVSYGVTGNQEIGNLRSLTTLGASTTGYSVGGTRVTVVLPTQYANPNLKWEQTSQVDFGMDFEFFEGRVTGNVDYYNKKTSDLLLSFAVPSPSVVPTQLANVGSVQNKGFEVTLGTRIIQKSEFSWRLSGNFSANRNKVLSLSNSTFSTDKIETAPVQGSGLSGVNAQLITPGQPIGTFYGLSFLGVKGGLEQFETDANGVALRSIIGNAQPDFIYGVSNSFTYKKFDAQVNMRGSVGNDILNLTALNLSYLSNMPGKNVLRSAIAAGVDRTAVKRYSSRWIEDGTFLRMDNLTIGYTLNVSSFKLLSNARLYLTGQNLFVITKYSGQDPEVNSNTNGSGAAPIGIDYLSYPRARAFSFGANFNF